MRASLCQYFHVLWLESDDPDFVYIEADVLGYEELPEFRAFMEAAEGVDHEVFV